MVGSLDKYIQDISKYPLISHERAVELAVIIRSFKGGKQKQAAREELINSNLRLVVKVSSKYKNFFNIPMIDLIGAGNVGLMKAADYYNPLKFNTRFSTYAFPIIRQSIFKMFYEFSSPVTIPSYIIDKSRKYKAILDSNKDMTDTDIMKSLDVTEEGLKKIRMSKTKVMSLDQEVHAGDGGSPITLGQVLEDTSAPQSDEQLQDSLLKEHVHEAIEDLSDMDQDIVVCMFFNDMTLRDVGARYGITSEAVRQRKRKALRKLRFRLKNKVV